MMQMNKPMPKYCSVSVDDFRQALGQLAAGVSIIATSKDGDCRGVTATAICSVTDSPGTVLVCVNRATGTGKMIADTGKFSVNLLGTDQEEVAKIFAGMGGVNGSERFQHGDWEFGAQTGLPILGGALVNLECSVTHIQPVASHDVFFGEVLEVCQSPARPLIYYSRGFHEPKALPV